MSKIIHHNGAYGWKYGYLGASTQTTALLMGTGSSTVPATTAAASKNFAQFYTQSTDATGADSRCFYLRHYLAGAGGSGETVRAFTTVNGAGATAAHGVHGSVSFGTNGTLTGEAAGVRATFQVPNKVISGTAAAVYAEFSADGASSNVQANHAAFMRAVLSGDGTGLALLDSSVGLFSIEGNTIGSGAIVHASAGTASTHSIRCFVNGVPFYILATTSA